MTARRRPTSFPANAAPQTVAAFGVNPAGAFQAAAIDEQYGLGMTHLSGTPRIGTSASAVSGWRYAGDLGPLQDFRGGAFVGKSAANIRFTPNVGLPSTAGPAPGLSPVTDLLRRIAEARSSLA